MHRSFASGLLLLACSVLATSPLAAKPKPVSLDFTTPDVDPDIVGDVDGNHRSPRKVQQDTLWIASWGFDTGAPCDDHGWQKVDNHVLNDGAIHWHVEATYDGTSGIIGNAGVVGEHDQVCCAVPNGYGNDWYQAIRILYTCDGLDPNQGGIQEGLGFGYLLDSEPGFDFLLVETDSACASFARLAQCRETEPFEACITAAIFRKLEFQASGLHLTGDIPGSTQWTGELTDFGAGTHCLTISFFSDGSVSHCDGGLPSSFGAGLVVDNITVVDAAGTRNEDFSDGTLDIGTFENIQVSQPFGLWGRLYPGITDNDLCTENRTCAWLWTDDTTPTIANDPSMAFAPGSFVIRNWLDDAILSPWVSLASTSSASGTVLQFRRFGGNFLLSGSVMQGAGARGRHDVGGRLCTTPVSEQVNSLGSFQWITLTQDVSSHLDPRDEEIQVRFRTADMRWITPSEPIPPLIPGPGPFLDDVRIGRVILHGPVWNEGIDARTQAQDCFPTEIHPEVGAGTGEHFRPTTDRFGSCAFSMAYDLANASGPNLVTGDSIVVQVQDVRGAGGIVSVEWIGAIVEGPHAGKAPPPWSAGASGFFVVSPESVRTSQGSIVEGHFFVDLDDSYFRGGDVLHYVWLASDALGGTTSDPVGLEAPPASPGAAQAATAGLLEVSFLPAIQWDPAYLARIASDAHGKLEPTAAELANSRQQNCILYVNHHNTRRRSGDVNRSSFMYTLDRLGYRGAYDVYDHMGMGNTNNHLGGRATVEQAQGYNFLVYDAGNRAPGLIVPDGSDFASQKVDQVSWFRSWLAQASLGEAGWVTLWLIASNALEERPTSPLYGTDMGAVLTAPDLATNRNPEVQGVTAFTFDTGVGSPTVDFTETAYVAREGCAILRQYDALDIAGTAVVTHVYRNPAAPTFTDGAIVMNASPENWNTILQSHPWRDIRDRTGGPALPPPEVDFLQSILDNVLPFACVHSPTPTDAGSGEELAAPRQTILYRNAPNPFNPMTTIRFDLARSGVVHLRIYDVMGRLVRTLVDGPMQAGWERSVRWDGRSDAGFPAASGVYWLRLEAPGFAASHKLVLMR
jgi:hypothetical protein